MSLWRAPARILGAITVAAVILAGCGSSGPSAKAQIAAVVKRVGTDPTSLCHRLTGSLLTRVGGMNACLRQAASARHDPTTHAASIHLQGNTAVVVEADRTGSHTIEFVEQNGVWKVAAIG